MSAPSLLPNVFHPVLKWDGVTGSFNTELELVNIHTASVQTLHATRADISDSNSNVFIGTSAGPVLNISNTNGDSNNTVVGAGAGTNMVSSTSNVFIGYAAGGGSVSNGTKNVAIGAATKGDGASNIYIGTGAGIAGGSNNILIGVNVSGIVAACNVFKIGSMMDGNLSTNALTLTGTTIVSNSGGTARLGVNTNNPTHTIHVAGDVYVNDGYGILSMDTAGTALNTTATSTFHIAPSISGRAFMRADQGFYSSNNTFTGLVTKVYTISVGTTLIQIKDTTTSNRFWAGGVFLPAVGSTPILLISNQSCNITHVASANTLTFNDLESGNTHIASFLSIPFL